jgi:putative tryptophan/tyrosine transport system substrate-binding protein
MRRREFITLLGGAATAWPLAARAQQPTMPVIGFVNPTSPEGYPQVIDEFRRGLAETGYVEGRNVIIEYRWAHGQYARLPALIDDLVRRKVAVIAATGGGAAAVAARAATTTIPIVFNSAGDPVKSGLVASLSRPGGNLTGVSRINTELLPKRLEFLAAVLPRATLFAFLINPHNPDHESRAREVESAGRALGRQIELFRSGDDEEIEAAFTAMYHKRIEGLLIANDGYFNARSALLGSLALRHGVPAIYQTREFAAAGGLMSYGPNLSDAYRIVGTYVGRILKGEKPADLPVQQQTKIDFFVNLKAARTLGLIVPLDVAALADEVIE